MKSIKYFFIKKRQYLQHIACGFAFVAFIVSPLSFSEVQAGFFSHAWHKIRHAPHVIAHATKKAVHKVESAAHTVKKTAEKASHAVTKAVKQGGKLAEKTALQAAHELHQQADKLHQAASEAAHLAKQAGNVLHQGLKQDLNALKHVGNVTGDALKHAGETTGKALIKAGKTTGKAFEKAGKETGKALKKAAEATGHAIVVAGKRIAYDLTHPMGLIKDVMTLKAEINKGLNRMGPLRSILTDPILTQLAVGMIPGMVLVMPAIQFMLMPTPEGGMAEVPMKPNAELVQMLQQPAANILVQNLCNPMDFAASLAHTKDMEVLLHNPAAVKAAEQKMFKMVSIGEGVEEVLKNATRITTDPKTGQKVLKGTPESLLILMMVQNGAQPDGSAAYNNFRGKCRTRIQDAIKRIKQLQAQEEKIHPQTPANQVHGAHLNTQHRIRSHG